MKPERKIAQARVSMLMDHPFFGYLAISLELVEKEHMFPPTMASDGARLYYHPDFIGEIPINELMGVIVHEIGHIILHHISRRQNRDPLKWNLATDYAVNDLVLKEFDLPSGVLHAREFADKTAEWIYNKLPDPEVISIKLVTLDSHEEWKGWGGNGGKGEGKGDKKETKVGTESSGEGEGETGESQSGLAGEDDLDQQWRERVAQAANAARMKGKLPGHIQTLVDGVLQPKLDWKTILRDMITSCAKSDFRLMPPSKKHLYRGYYLPSVTGEEIQIAVVIDSSGSISDEEIKEFLAEVKGICDSYQEYTIYLYTCDARIHQRFELHPFDPLPTIVEGRGGTSFKEPIKEAGNLPITSLVYLTDLYGDFPSKEPWFPVIWVSVSDADAPWGTIIRLPKERR